MSTLKQKKIIALFNNLFSSGFHLVEMIDFLGRSALLEASYVDRLRDGLSTGQTFSSLMGQLGFSDQVVTQLSLAESHGNLALSLTKIEVYLENLWKVKKKLIEVGSYPVILLSFLLLIMLGLREYLLPQLDRHNVATQAIHYLPQLFLLGVALFVLLIGGGILLCKRKSRLTLLRCLTKMPFLSCYLKLYLTAFYAREWGNMIGQGLELSQIFHMMQQQRSRLFREIGADLEQALQNGQTFSQTIQQYPFFTKELSLIVEYGEVKARLGQELELYAEKTWELFFYRINQAMNLVQPLVFIFVACMIVLLYAAMLLPLYQNMEVQW